MERPTFIYAKNPNKEEYAMVSEAVEANEGYCCCAIEKTPETKCMCAEFRESENSGFCHCRRYYKVRKSETLGIVVDITEGEGADAFQRWFERFTKEDFVVIPIIYNSYSMVHGTRQHIDICKAAVYKCDAIFVINAESENEHFMAEIIEWTEDLGKKIIYERTLRNEN